MIVQSVVYFIEHDGLIKIGFTADLAARALHVPGRLITWVPGGRAEERFFHDRFAALRETGGMVPQGAAADRPLGCPPPGV